MKNIIVYILSILMGVNITYWGTTSYLENCEIREEGIEVEVVMIKETRYTKNGSVPQVKYNGKIHDWHGKKEKAGTTYKAIYSPSKEKLLDKREEWHVFYFPISLGVFFMIIGIYGITSELFFSKS
ncbi:hypothetical protein WAF17_13825 [Bernardetia sp. ABR2-2B]|uniref:hypothetical protein n=1 Tax=Bernardetia sp. ABR2-2B TaxID=3127472 RepID=UPI0030CE1BFD